MDTLFLGGGMPVETLSTQALFTEYLYISSQLQAIISFRPGSSMAVEPDDAREVENENIEKCFVVLDAITAEIRRRVQDEKLGLRGADSHE